MMRAVSATGNGYLDKIFKISHKYLSRTFDDRELDAFKNRCIAEAQGDDTRDVIDSFIKIYYETIKERYQSQHPHDQRIVDFLSGSQDSVKIIWGDCLDALRGMKSESVQLMVTSPPYYNAREYSQWPDIDAYLADMESIIQEAYRVLDNHRVFVFNVGDIFDNDRKVTQSTWGKRRIPLGAYFTQIFERVGFQFVDDFIWDKGQTQSQRHKNGNRPYPLYQYPVNCYEHIFVFYKHRLDSTLYPCPICGCLKVNGNAYSNVGVRSWECKNLDCTERSLGNRGKRFSVRHKVMTDLQRDENRIPSGLLAKWRRDIVQFPPVIKINSKGENTLGHTAPFPPEIPAYAVQVFSGKGDWVLDPFAGSFTTAIEAVRLGRVGIGVELNKEMFGAAVIENIRRQLPPSLMGRNTWEELEIVNG